MSRIAEVNVDAVADRALVDAIVARRGARGLIQLDRMLLHSPEYARGWNAFLGAVRTRLAIAAPLRELAICAVARLTGADFEWQQHVIEWRRAGARDEQVVALEEPVAAAANAQLFSALERAVLKLVVEMTSTVTVTDATFNEVRHHLSDIETVELVGVIAAYNCVARFLVALEIDRE